MNHVSHFSNDSKRPIGGVRMLEVRPNCEYCDCELKANSTNAYICTYECTFCQQCVENVLDNVCPNCGGGFSQRPIRPTNEYRKGLGLKNHPSSTKRVNTKYSLEEIQEFSNAIKGIDVKER